MSERVPNSLPETCDKKGIGHVEFINMLSLFENKGWFEEWCLLGCYAVWLL
jgi:hypothetical protein